MKVKTAELIGPALDWAVWNCAGGVDAYPKTASGAAFLKLWKGNSAKYIHPSTDWAQGGPIIEREKITVVCAEGDYNHSKAGTSECYDTYWVATKGMLSASDVYGPQGDDWGYCFQIDADDIQGPTPLIAAMRCYVASKLGDEVEVPNELT